MFHWLQNVGNIKEIQMKKQKMNREIVNYKEAFWLKDDFQNNYYFHPNKK